MKENDAIDLEIYGTENVSSQLPTEGNQPHTDDSQTVKDGTDIEVMDEVIPEKGSPKRKKNTSKVWGEFDEVTLKDGTKKLDCKYCHVKLFLSKDGSTSHLIRHMKACSIRLASISRTTQKVLSYPILEADGNIGNVNYFKYDKEKVRELLVKMLCVHEYPFRMYDRA